MKRAWRAVRQVACDADGTVVLFQTPNLPLLVWLMASLIMLVMPGGHWRAGISFVGSAALVIWSYLEIRSGATPLRRLMGGVVLAYILIGHFR